MLRKIPRSLWDHATRRPAPAVDLARERRIRRGLAGLRWQLDRSQRLAPRAAAVQRDDIGAQDLEATTTKALQIAIRVPGDVP